MRRVCTLLAVLSVFGTLTPAQAETRSEYLHRIAKANAEMQAQRHEINVERSAKKITRDQAIEQMRAVLEKNKEAHKQL